MFVFLLTLLLCEAQDIKFEKKTVTFDNGAQLKVEMAATAQEKEQGLMMRTSLAEGKGMIFVFQPAQPLSFWMKNTLIQLSIGFFRENRTLIEVKDMEPIHGPVREELLPRYVSSEPAMYAIEVPKGWFTRRKIKPGMRFRLN